MDNFTLEAVGIVNNNVTEKVDQGWGEVRSRIVLKPEYAGGLKGLEGFSHVIIVCRLHEAAYDARNHLQRHPQGRSDMPLVGIFAQRVKDRPNPIGLTTVKLLAVGGDWLDVSGLDAINGTPVLDIKPYFPDFDRPEEFFIPPWVEKLMQSYWQ